MTTLLDFLREARSRLGRAWDLLVTGEDPLNAREMWYAAEDYIRENVGRLDAEMLARERKRTIEAILAQASNAP